MTAEPVRHDEDEPGSLAWLSVHEQAAERDARVRARCHAALEKRRRWSLSPARPAWRRALEPVIVGSACAVFLIEVLGRAVLLYRF
jgi:hypothetical protein